MYKELYKMIYEAKTAGKTSITIWPALLKARINATVSEVFTHFEEQGYTIKRDRHSFEIDWSRMPSKAPGLYESAIELITDARSRGEVSITIRSILPKNVVKQLNDDGYIAQVMGNSTFIDFQHHIPKEDRPKTAIALGLEIIRNLCIKTLMNIF